MLWTCSVVTKKTMRLSCERGPERLRLLCLERGRPREDMTEACKIMMVVDKMSMKLQYCSNPWSKER